MDDDTQEAERRWVYQVVRRELPAKPGEGARYALDQWVRERERERPVIAPTTRQPSQRPMGHRRSLLPRRLPKKRAREPSQKSYRPEDAQPFHGLYRLVRVEPNETGRSFRVHAVCTGPYCGGKKTQVFEPHFWIASPRAQLGCIRCSNHMRLARLCAERAARDGDVKGVAT